MVKRTAQTEGQEATDPGGEWYGGGGGWVRCTINVCWGLRFVSKFASGFASASLFIRLFVVAKEDIHPDARADDD